MKPEVRAALALLRTGKAASVTEAARATGAARTTVRDNWDLERNPREPQRAATFSGMNPLEEVAALVR